MVVEIISPGFIVMSFFVGIGLGFITIATGNPVYKIIDVIAIFGIVIGLMAFMPDSGTHMTPTQMTNQISGLMLYFVNVVIPFVVGDAISSVGYMIVTGKK